MTLSGRYIVRKRPHPHVSQSSPSTPTGGGLTPGRTPTKQNPPVCLPWGHLTIPAPQNA